ncbi:hypothetical protein [Longibaculum muris]|uniref:hypothetical protein n=1 Tax=Longibaculum muris TaxID=1796628 RepID=UPI0029436F5E|nr:hypothetical protein [Longibaculum muris]
MKRLKELQFENVLFYSCITMTLFCIISSLIFHTDHILTLSLSIIGICVARMDRYL